MATVINKRDSELQAAIPRLVTVNLGTTVNVDGTLNGTPVATVTAAAIAAANHIGLTGNVHGVSLVQIAGDLDDINDGVSFYRTNANQVTGAGRAFNALNSTSEYIKSLKSTQLTVVGSNPSTGWVGDVNGIRLYQSGVLKMNLPITGSPYFQGDITGGANIDIDGSARFNGNTSQAGQNNSVVANSSRGQKNGVLSYDGSASDSVAGGFVSTSVNGMGVETSASGTGGKGIMASGSGAGRIGVQAIGTSGAVALSVLGTMTMSSTSLVSNLNSERWGGHRIASDDATGIRTATFAGNNKLGASNTTNTWIQITLGNGEVKYIPVWQ